jgi:signal peptidase I
MEQNSEKSAVKSDSWNWKEILKLAVISLAIVVPFRLYVAQPFVVEGASMYPTFKNGNYLIVDELTYHFKTPARGSVLVFKYPKDTSKSFIKRVIGLPGEIVSLKNGQVTITSSEYPQGLVLDEPYIEMPKSDDLTYTLGEDEYFVMGDNRLQSADSRLWGPVPAKDIIGRPILRVVPFSLLPGNHSAYPVSSSEPFKNNNP